MLLMWIPWPLQLADKLSVGLLIWPCNISFKSHLVLIFVPFFLCSPCYLFMYLLLLFFSFPRWNLCWTGQGQYWVKVKYGGEQQKFGDRETLGWRILTSIQSWQWLEVEKNHVYPFVGSCFFPTKWRKLLTSLWKIIEETWFQRENNLSRPEA